MTSDAEHTSSQSGGLKTSRAPRWPPSAAAPSAAKRAVSRTIDRVGGGDQIRRRRLGVVNNRVDRPEANGLANEPHVVGRLEQRLDRQLGAQVTRDDGSIGQHAASSCTSVTTTGRPSIGRLASATRRSAAAAACRRRHHNRHDQPSNPSASSSTAAAIRDFGAFGDARSPPRVIGDHLIVLRVEGRCRFSTHR